MIAEQFNLTITESAYYAVLNIVSQMNLIDPLPALTYNDKIKAYEISAYSLISVNEIKNKYAKENRQLVYQIGRLNMLIENPELIKQINGKCLNYINGSFIIT